VQKDPQARPNVRQLVEHPFIALCGGGQESIAATVEVVIKAKAAEQAPETAAEPASSQAPVTAAVAAATVTPAAAVSTGTPAETQHVRRPSSTSSALVSVIYPSLTGLLQQNKEDDQVVAAIARLKVAFDTLEKKKPGSVHAFLSQTIDAIR
jgi:MFS-type transporter involved in bile tolerance (Atg22 family)